MLGGMVRFGRKIVNHLRKMFDQIVQDPSHPDDAGRPTLVVPRRPSTQPSTLSFDSVLVAWDGTIEAAHALSGALPFLKTAREVVVISINPDDQSGPSAVQAAGHLERYGIAVKVEERKAERQNIGEELNAIARQCGAELIVMGAFVSRPWRHFVHGSATADLIRHTDVPLLMAH